MDPEKPKIKFVKTLRDCGHNRQPENAKKLIYDYYVMIDGEHRAIFSRYSAGAHKYQLYDAHHAILQHTRREPGYKEWTHSVTVGPQSEFLPMIEKMLAQGEIPTVKEQADAKDARAQAKETERLEALQARRDNVLRAHGKEIYEALNNLVGRLCPSGSRAIALAMSDDEKLGTLVDDALILKGKIDGLMQDIKDDGQ